MISATRALVLITLVTSTGCVPNARDVVADTDGSTGNDADSTHGAAASTGPLGNTSDVDPGATTSSPATTTDAVDSSTGSTAGEVCIDSCIVEFPCNGSEPRCVDAMTIEVWETQWALEDCSNVLWVCGNDACFCKGGYCERIDPVPCPPDTRCVEQGTASCVPTAEACGGPEGLSCGDTELCEYDEGLCPECLDAPEGCGLDSPLGLCVPRPARTDDCGMPRPGDEQCGCDGVEYANECERRSAGVALADHGPCRA